MSTATETFADATITGSKKDIETKVDVEYLQPGPGIRVEASSSVNNLRFTLNDGGNLESTGAALKKARFTFTGGGQIEITNEALKSARVTGSSEGDTLTINGSAVKNLRIDLGDQDGERDVVEFDQLDESRAIRIENFGDEDLLIIDGNTLNKSFLQNNPFKNITIDFD